MLRFLTIRRLAVIEAVEVEFASGFTALTGETGAGKSILIEAVGLLLGGRASGELVRTGAESATIEAILDTPQGEFMLRRDVTAQGRSRAFINGDLATVGALRELAAQSVELHGQHEHQTLLDPARHREVLDGVANLASLVSATGTAYQAWRLASDALRAATSTTADRERRLEFAQFQLDELDKAALVPGEDEELSSTRALLHNADRIQRLCGESYGALYEQDGAVLATLSTVWRKLGELAALDPVFLPFVEAKDGIKAQLEDVSLFLRNYLDTVDVSPARLQQVEDRLALVERLKRKYGPTLAQVLTTHATLRTEVATLADAASGLGSLTRAVADAADAYRTAAAALSEARHRAAGPFARSLEAVLSTLALERSVFEVRVTSSRDDEACWTAAGVDQVEFWMSANPGEDPRPLARIASGGELSRVMLAIKSVSARQRFGARPEDARVAPTLVFDEVDAGIGGRVADVVGRTLRELGLQFQVLCITHLPQIAASADAHLLIEKHVEASRTHTLVHPLTGDRRVDELARMLGGSAITAGIRASAQELLTLRQTAPTQPPSPPTASAVVGTRRRSRE